MTKPIAFPSELVPGTYVTIPIDYAKPNPANENEHDREQIDFLRSKYRRLGQQKPIVIRPDGLMEAGHGWWIAMKEEGAETIEARVTDLEGNLLDEFRVSDNVSAGMSRLKPELLVATKERLGDAFDPALFGFLPGSNNSFEAIIAGGAQGNERQSPGVRTPPTREEAYKTLAERFLVPPFSVLDGRQGYWQERKRSWLALGIKSEVGRGANLLGFSDTVLQPDPAKRKAAGMEMGGKYRDPTPEMGGKPDNPEAAIPGYYRMKNEGWSHEEIVEWWVNRKRARDAQAIGNTEWLKEKKGEDSNALAAAFDGTSIFDPVLCEIAYRWFSSSMGLVIDPFAGGSVRGVVAAKLQRRYFGTELRKEQVEANRAQLETIECDPAPVWVEGDSREIRKLFQKKYKGKKADLIFTCPPYGDLEKYSDDKRDISNVPWEEFLKAYKLIIAEACALLEENRFAVFVIGEFRAPDGVYRNFVGETVAAFAAAGLGLYNEAIFVQPVGSLPVRAGKQFVAGRKMGKTHQQFLVFVKGDWRKAVESCGEIKIEDFLDPEALEAALAAEASAVPPAQESSNGSAPKGEATQYGEKLTLADLGGGV